MGIQQPLKYATAAIPIFLAILFGFFIKINHAAENDSARGMWRNCSFGTMDYLNGSMTEPIQLGCAGYCPPYRPTDSSVYYCWKNCEDYMKCVLERVENGHDVMYDLQQRVNRPNTCPFNTWFYHILHGFISCLSVCNSTRKDHKFCRANCPDLYKCLGLNRSSTIATLLQSLVNEFSPRTSQTADRQPSMPMNTTTVTTPTVRLNTLVSLTESGGNNYTADSQSQGHDKLLIVLSAAVIALTIIVLLVIILYRWRRYRATHALPVPVQQNDDVDNRDDHDDNLSTHTQTPRSSSFHGDQETQPPAEHHPLIASNFTGHQSIGDASEEETAPKTHRLRTNNGCSRYQTLYPLLSGSLDLTSEDCSPPTLATADNESNEESLHVRLQLDRRRYSQLGVVSADSTGV